MPVFLAATARTGSCGYAEGLRQVGPRVAQAGEAPRQAFMISLDSAGYAPGEYRGSVEISPTGNGPARQVSVTLLVFDRLHWSYCPLLLQ